MGLEEQGSNLSLISSNSKGEMWLNKGDMGPSALQLQRTSQQSKSELGPMLNMIQWLRDINEHGNDPSVTSLQQVALKWKSDMINLLVHNVSCSTNRSFP